jgi:hypothetical protein
MDLWRKTRVDALLLLKETVEEVARDMKWKDSIRGFLKKAREAIGIRTLEMEGMNNRQRERKRECDECRTEQNNRLLLSVCV